MLFEDFYRRVENEEIEALKLLSNEMLCAAMRDRLKFAETENKFLEDEEINVTFSRKLTAER